MSNNNDISNITRIQGTNDNSILSKCSMIKYGYFNDEFLPYMIRKFSRRAPLINRGYYIRAKAVEYLLLNFIEHCQDKQFQIISLGAGFDTSFFRLTNQGKLENCTFIEMDYFDVAQRKAILMQQESKLWNCLKYPESVQFQKDNYIMINAVNYKLIGVDLIKMDILDACIRASGVSFDLPTLFLSECVITYISTKKSSNLLKFITKSFPKNCFVLYEQINPDDSFGKFMCQHFKQLGSSLRGIMTYKTKENQIHRFLNNGWDTAIGCDMSEFYYNVIGSEEKLRIENLEVFDEYEEWLLKCTHYMVLVACKGMNWNPQITATKHSLSSSLLEHSLSFSKVTDKNTESGNDFNEKLFRIARLNIQSYTSDSTELFRNGGIKTHYVKADIIYSDDNREYLLRASGYGQNPFSSGHCRLVCLSILDLQTNVITHIEPDQSDLLLNSLCGSFTKIYGNDFIVFGGRSSPLKPNNIVTYLRLEFDNSKSRWMARCTELCANDLFQKPSSRWRHLAGVYWIWNKPYLLIYGGRNSDPCPMSDTHVFNIEDNLWTPVIDGTSPGPLCSASVVSIGKPSGCVNNCASKCCGCCCLLVFGGLQGSDLTPSANLWRWCGRFLKWTKIETTNDFVPRFSHTSHIGFRDADCCAKTVSLVSVGGVSHKRPTIGLSVISINLVDNKAHCEDLVLDMNNQSECVMVHNHASAFSERTKQIWIVGGGGNCFSFGTQLNENIYYIDVDREVL